MMILNASGIFLPNTWLGLAWSIIRCFTHCIYSQQIASGNHGAGGKIHILWNGDHFLVTTLLAYYRYLQVYKNEGIIVTTSTALYEALDLISPTIDTLPLGTKYTMMMKLLAIFIKLNLALT